MDYGLQTRAYWHAGSSHCGQCLSIGFFSANETRDVRNVHQVGSIRRNWLARASVRPLALVATAVLWSAAALAGDQPGCCDDLESRIAATAARKGNRRVSLEVSGHVHRALMLWSDGSERNAYIIDPTNYGSNAQFSGEAKITGKLQAGFVLSLDVPNNESFSLSQDVTAIPGQPAVARAHVFISHENWGRLALGRETEAHDHITENDHSGTGLFAGPAVTDWNGSFFIRGPSAKTVVPGDLTWSAFGSSSIGDGDNANVIRYDTPVFSGLQLAASWGAVDVIAGSVRYTFDNDAVEIESGAAIAHYGDAERSPCIDLAPVANCLTFAGSISILHKSSQISLTGAGGMIADDPRRRPDGSIGRDYWVYGKVAQEYNLTDLGGTVVFAEYFHGRHSGQIERDAVASGGLAEADFSAVTDVFGIGVMQSIDEADMQVYVAWRTYAMSGDAALGAAGAREALQLDDFQVFMTGTRISF
jgi:hypothetical protein